ncbi:GNAT family N-acetyltransferase [Staphylococcus auricularis]|uniref:GNAT family N-acetyltransferase n=1 Tax=Staphylococcus auricularis TaxID=29379 RepID=UPI003EBA25D3
MTRIKAEDNEWIMTLAQLHETQHYEQGFVPEVTSFSIGLRVEMIYRRLFYENDYIEADIVHDQLRGVIWGHYDDQNQTVCIEFLYVEPEYRHQHIGTQLKQQLEQWAKKQGAIEITSTVKAHNIEMVRLNQHLGYDIDQYVMRKSLTSGSEPNDKE